MPPLKNARQEIYVQNWFKGKTKEDAALIAGYAPKWARSIGSRLSTNVNIIARYNELQKKAEDASVADVLERKQILTEIARGRLVDFVTVGKDGAWFNIGEETLNSRALALATSKTMLGKDGADDAVIIKVGLHNPVPAIDLLNKMDKIYGDGINIDARSIHVGEEGDDPKRTLIGLLERIATRAREVEVARQSIKGPDEEAQL